MKRLNDMRPDEINSGGFTKAILPIGATEGHGPHLPTGTDIYIAEGIAYDIADRFDDMLVLPSISYGVSENHMMFPYTVSISPETMINMLDEIFDSLYRRGIFRIIVINGHNGNTAPIEIAGRRAHQLHPEMKVSTMPAWWLVLDKLLPPGTLSPENGWHAGETETALSLAYFGKLVDMDLAEDCPPRLPYSPLMDMKYTIDEMSRKGSVGRPTRADTEKGEAIRKALIDEAERYIRALDDIDWDYSI